MTDPYLAFCRGKLGEAEVACNHLADLVNGCEDPSGSCEVCSAALPALEVAQDTRAHWRQLVEAMVGDE